MMIKLQKIIAILIVTLSTAAQASTGAELFQKCVLCHGQNGEGKASEKAPQIAGQYDWYIKKAITDFKTGARKNPVMLPYIKNLSPSYIDQLAQYISQLKVQ